MFEGFDPYARGTRRGVLVCGMLCLALLAWEGCAHRVDVVAAESPQESDTSSGAAPETDVPSGFAQEPVASSEGSPDTNATSGGLQPPRDVLPFIHDDFARAANEARARKLPILVEAWAGW